MPGRLPEFDSSGSDSSGNNSVCAGRAEVGCARLVLSRGDWSRGSAAELMEAPCWPLARAQAGSPRWPLGTRGKHTEPEAVAWAGAAEWLGTPEPAQGHRRFERFILSSLRLCRRSLTVVGTHFSEFARCRIEQDNVCVVMRQPCTNNRWKNGANCSATGPPPTQSWVASCITPKSSPSRARVIASNKRPRSKVKPKSHASEWPVLKCPLMAGHQTPGETVGAILSIRHFGAISDRSADCL